MRTINAILMIVMIVLFGMISTGYAESQFGVLKVIASQDTARIYIDGNFEGAGTVSRDKIIIGNHLVQIKDENKITLFEEMVSVREGEQTTVVAKTEGVMQNNEISPQNIQQTPSGTQSQYNKYHNVLGLEASYGPWNANVAGYSIQSSEPGKEIGLYLKTITDNNAFAKTSFHYILPFSGATSNVGTFVGLDIGGQSDLVEASVGLNYFFSAISGTTGGLGYQAYLGFKIANASIGAKYLILNGSSNSSYYYSSIGYSYSQLLLCASVDFGK